MRRFETLDGLRGVAAIVVMVMHASETAHLSLFRNGGLAVDFFFILSGFVLAHAYTGRAGLTFGPFMLKRLVRLYPMFLFGLMLGAVALFVAIAAGTTTLSPAWGAVSVALNLVYLPFFNAFAVTPMGGAPVVGGVFPANPPQWSLHFELVANLFFLTLLRCSTRVLAAISLASLVLLVAFARYVEHRSGVPGLSIFMGWSTGNFIGGFPRVMYGFVAGMVLHRAVSSRTFDRVEAALARVPLAEIAIMAAIAVVLGFGPDRLRGAYHLAVVLVLAPVLVFAGAAVEPPAGRRMALVKWLGWISYPIYCVHVPVLMLLGSAAQAGYLPVSAVLPLTIVLAFVLAAIGAAWFDEPVRARINAWLKQRRTA
ncbi:acyltransferase family protein [Sphingomonas adhaesiva]|uniref:acyltransferase family protein n=1 Tax=Sphingomonas adhaesiva TaxID=28212 RepID=UPI002FF45139